MNSLMIVQYTIKNKHQMIIINKNKNKTQKLKIEYNKKLNKDFLVVRLQIIQMNNQKKNQKKNYRNRNIQFGMHKFMVGKMDGTQYKLNQ